MNTPRKTCTKCGAELPLDAVHGLCPRCLLHVGLGSQSDPEATVDFDEAAMPCILPEIGKPFGPYRVLRLLGQGGMGVVYEAEEQETGRRVALKVLGHQLASQKDRARFLREGRLAASINHPNSVYVFGTDEIDSTPTISMELVSGGTLQQRIKDHGPMPVPDAVDAILQIIAGLEAAHAIGILHRDIKPGNCFEDADGSIKIGDFGLSISTAARAEPEITATGSLVGTPAFCSPEQLRGDELNIHSDMYSVGGTLFYLLTGRVPFEGQNIVQLTANVLEKPAPSPRNFRNDIPKGLTSVIQRCLAKGPTDRFKTYDDLRRALAPYGSAAPTPATLSLRLLAGALDMIILNVVLQAISISLMGSPAKSFNAIYDRPAAAMLLFLGTFSASLLYYAIFEGFWGAAAGKTICRLRVVRPDKSPPGFARALTRDLIYVMLPALPLWIFFGVNPKAIAEASLVYQQAAGFSFYIMLALLFCTVRRRNGFAAVHDLATTTRVVSRAAIEARPVLAVVELPPSVVDGNPTVGPYHVLDTLETNDDGEWLLGYDLRLLRKVWIHRVPSGTPPLDESLRKIGRVGRLRWLTSRRSAEESWDVFEGVEGKPLLHLISEPQPWSQVRFWLFDLAQEISTAEKDGTCPSVLALDRVWITSDGRAKLLDFPTPGLAAATSEIQAEKPATLESLSVREFLAGLAVAALEGRAEAAVDDPAIPSVPLPLHARRFFEHLSETPDAGAITTALQPLLHRLTSISRWRRAAVIAGCAAIPVLMASFLIMAMSAMQNAYPGIMELSQLLQQRRGFAWVARLDGPTKANRAERQLAVYIAAHYRKTITNKALWENPFTLSMIKGDDRRFAEQCLIDHPTPNEKEVAEAEAALKPHLTSFNHMMSYPFTIMLLLLGNYICLPAILTALFFRGGLALRAASMTYVRRDGRSASRLRLFWRALVAWSPLWLAPFVIIPMLDKHNFTTMPDLPAMLLAAVLLTLSALSVALPKRGLPDRLSGTWPVPR